MRDGLCSEQLCWKTLPGQCQGGTSWWQKRWKCNTAASQGGKSLLDAWRPRSSPMTATPLLAVGLGRSRASRPLLLGGLGSRSGVWGSPKAKGGEATCMSRSCEHGLGPAGVCGPSPGCWETRLGPFTGLRLFRIPVWYKKRGSAGFSCKFSPRSTLSLPSPFEKGLEGIYSPALSLLSPPLSVSLSRTTGKPKRNGPRPAAARCCAFWAGSAPEHQTFPSLYVIASLK